METTTSRKGLLAATFLPADVAITEELLLDYMTEDEEQLLDSFWCADEESVREGRHPWPLNWVLPSLRAEALAVLGPRAEEVLEHRSILTSVRAPLECWEYSDLPEVFETALLAMAARDGLSDFTFARMMRDYVYFIDKGDYPKSITFEGVTAVIAAR